MAFVFVSLFEWLYPQFGWQSPNLNILDMGRQNGLLHRICRKTAYAAKADIQSWGKKVPDASVMLTELVLEAGFPEASPNNDRKRCKNSRAIKCYDYCKMRSMSKARDELAKFMLFRTHGD
ncbi:hypothetical protein CR513_24129, partial [Mucuna pruriens]